MLWANSIVLADLRWSSATGTGWPVGADNTVAHLLTLIGTLTASRGIIRRASPISCRIGLTFAGWR
jgi:hypothetical protein